MNNKNLRYFCIYLRLPKRNVNRFQYFSDYMDTYYKSYSIFYRFVELKMSTSGIFYVLLYFDSERL